MNGLISSDTINAVQQATDIVSVIGEYTKLERRGNDWWGCCPFHNEKTASFHVDPDKKFYYCFGCHAGGDVIKFIMEIEKLSYTEAVTSLAKRAGIEVVYTNGTESLQQKQQDNIKDQYLDLYNRLASTFHYMLMQTEAGKAAIDYIKKRGLSEEIIEKFKLGYSPSDRFWLKSFLTKKNYSNKFLSNSGLFSKKYPDSAFFSDRLMFPIFNRKGQTVAFGGRILYGTGPKYLNSSDLIQYKKGETLYAFNFAKKSIMENKKVIFCEGYMDVIAYHQCGITYAVAPLGTALTEKQIHLVSNFADTILLSFDSDGAGQQATKKAIYLCRRLGLTVKIIQLQNGKDPSEIMLNFGKEILTNYVNSAILDNEYLLSVLANEYSVNTPEGKTKAALEFFTYIDSLQTDMQKDSCLEQLSQVYNLKPEAVRRDYENRAQSVQSALFRQRQRIVQQKPPIREIKLNFELRTILAVMSEPGQYEKLHSELTADDFEDSLAKELFIILEKCFKEGNVSPSAVLTKCRDENVQNMITRVIASGEFKNNTLKLISDSIKQIKRTTLEKRRKEIIHRIGCFNPITEEDRNMMKSLLSEKMKIDNKLKK